jgi:hypothetical protein
MDRHAWVKKEREVCHTQFCACINSVTDCPPEVSRGKLKLICRMQEQQNASNIDPIGAKESLTLRSESAKNGFRLRVIAEKATTRGSCKPIKMLPC